MNKLAALIALVPIVASAQGPDYPRDCTITWTNPTEYVDGTVIEFDDGLTVEMTVARNDGSIVLDRAVPPVSGAPGETLSHVFAGCIPQPGTYIFVAFAVVASVSSDPSESAVVRYTGKPLPPIVVVVE